MLEMIRQDVRYAFRTLARTPGFTLAAALTLALGIGANATIFSVFDTVILRPLPYRDADRLYVIHEVIGAERFIAPANALHFREWRASTRSFEEMALLGFISPTLAGAGEPVRIDGARVTPNLFRTLGIDAALGRLFLEEEDAPGRDAIIVLGHELWRTQFGADPQVVNRSVLLDGEPHVIVGVLPASFDVPKLGHLYDASVPFGEPQLWKPFAATPRDLRPLGSFNHAAIARLGPGVSPAQALEDLDVVQAAIARNAPERAEFRAALVPLADQLVSRSRTALQLVLSAVAMVLLIACVNVTNLLLSRGGRRQREFAIRRAAGAHRSRLVSQTVVESLVLSMFAGLIGVTLSAILVPIIQAYAPIDVPRLDEIRLDGRSLLFTLGVTIASGLLIGLLPAWRTTRTSPVDVLRSSSATVSSGKGAGRLRSCLVGVEMAASMVCVVASALLLSSFVKLLNVDRGFDVDRIVTADFITLTEPRYDTEGGIRFLTTLAERARDLPGVRSAGITDMLPLSGLSSSAIMVEGTTLPRQQRPGAMIRFADRGYFDTMGIQLRTGRLLEEADRDRQVAVVTTLTAQRLWPQQNPLGKRFRHGPDDSPWVEVVGVVRDVRGVTLGEAPPLTIYRPVDFFYGLGALAVKTTGNPEAVAAGIQNIMRALDPELAIPTPRTMEDVVAGSVAQRRFQMNLVVLLAAAAAFLAALGIYAVISQAVLQRTSEFGIRMAVGANPGRIRALVLRQGLWPVLNGLAAGVAASLALGRVLESLLFDVSPTDLSAFAAAGALLLLIALLASLIPAWRASRIDPITALRYE